jgi:hypothetical protein
MTNRKTYNLVSKFVYGQTVEQALAAKNCLVCKALVDRDALDDTELENYVTSAMCPKCYAMYTADDYSGED